MYILSLFDVLLTVHLSIFISLFNQLDAQNLLHSKFYFMPLHVSSTCANHQQVKIALHSLWYHHTYRWPSGARVERELFHSKFISCLYMFRAHVPIISRSKLHYTASGIITPIGGRLVHRLRDSVMIPEAVKCNFDLLMM